MKSHGRTIGEFIPVWEMKYLPKENFIVDEDRHIINTFQLTKYMRGTPRMNNDFPTIRGIIHHMLGIKEGKIPTASATTGSTGSPASSRQQRPITNWVCQLKVLAKTTW